MTNTDQMMMARRDAEIEAAAAKYAVTLRNEDYAIVKTMAARGRAKLVELAAKTKLLPDSERKTLALGLARVAWEVAQ
jgi:BMFP domain-containing protein YqiC